MAKELPYFKFEPAEWDSGTIQMCSTASKGLFIDMCALYWTRLGEVPYKLVLQKLCNSNAGALQELLEERLFVIEDNMVVIDFLDKQLNEFQETSEKRRKAANKRWNNASALQVESKSKAIRVKKSKEEEKKEESAQTEIEIFPTFQNFYDLYQKKVDRDLAEKSWNKVSQRGKEEIMKYIPLYIASEPDKQYRRNPSVFINKKTWQNEIIDKSNNSGSKIPQEPDKGWINTVGKDKDLYQAACKIWRDNGWAYVQVPGSTVRRWQKT